LDASKKWVVDYIKKLVIFYVPRYRRRTPGFLRDDDMNKRDKLKAVSGARAVNPTDPKLKAKETKLVQAVAQDAIARDALQDFVTDCLAYSGNAVRIAALKEEQAGLVSANGELRKKIVPFFKEHKDEKWSSLGKKIKAAIIAAGVKDVDGLLGVLKTSFEYNILPTEQNADRLRKRDTWVSWSGMVVPNTYGKVHKPKEETASIQTDSAPINPPVAPPTPEATPTTPAVPPASNTGKAVSTKAATPQKAQEPIHPISSNVSGDSEAHISPREHCGILLDQLFKNEAFRGEFAPILAMCLDSNVATVTRCLVEARDAMLNGKGVK
jgi:hypothetical protein